MKDIQSKTEYCLNCKNKPCVQGCPLGNDIPAFIALAKEHKYKEAFDVLNKTTVMPYICGRICPKSKQCQGKCTRGIKGDPVEIGLIESTIGDMAIKNGWYLENEKIKLNGLKIAVIGAGPAGITVSIELARKGYSITLFEKQKKIGGLLTYGIPEFRLDKKYVDIIEKQMESLGIEIKTNSILEENLNLQDLLTKYDKVILCNGANISCKMGIEGETLENVLGANELLEYGNFPDFTNKNVTVIGGGNVAIDIARVALRKSPKNVTIIYRRAREQMPAEQKEVEDAISEGIDFLFKTNIKKIEEDKIHLIKMDLIKKEGEERLSPIEITGSDFTLDADYVIMAIGSKFDKKILNNKIELNDKGYIKINENYQTNIKNVYACGDCIGEKATVAWASHYGKELAKAIIRSE